jgi:type II secretory ATPase GspE/PulE/Tfp pilus assembly ATPase PilB-like protein
MSGPPWRTTATTSASTRDDDGLEKVRHGMTSIEDVTRVTGTGAAAVEI